MTTGNARNVAASVRAKLLNIANREGSEFGLVLTRFALERLLYRLSESTYRDQFILKGALLFQAWTQKAHRPTRDLDLLGNGNPSAELCEKTFREISDISVADDGLVFFPETVRVEEIKEEQEYEGVRVKFLARLENARIQLQVDIGFGDAVTPSVLHYPTLLSMPAPRIQAYPMETVVAEKAEAIVSLGMLNSRMKDFYDIWFLAQMFQFDGQALSAAVRATFRRRRTQLDSDSLANLLAELSEDASKRIQWAGVSKKKQPYGT